MLRAGEQFRARLRPEIRRILQTEFPYLERRHEHVPDGTTHAFEFPRSFASFIETGTLDDDVTEADIISCVGFSKPTCISTNFFMLVPCSQLSFQA